MVASQFQIGLLRAMGEEEMARATPGKKQGMPGRGQELGNDVVEAIAKLAALLRR